GGVQCLARIVSNRISRNLAQTGGLTERGESVWQTAGRATGNRSRHDRVLSRIASQRLAVTLVRIRLWTGNERGSKWRGSGAKTQDCGNAGSVHDSTRGDDRDAQLAHE